MLVPSRGTPPRRPLASVCPGRDEETAQTLSCSLLNLSEVRRSCEQFEMIRSMHVLPRSPAHSGGSSTNIGDWKCIGT